MRTCNLVAGRIHEREEFQCVDPDAVRDRGALPRRAVPLELDRFGGLGGEGYHRARPHRLEHGQVGRDIPARAIPLLASESHRLDPHNVSLPFGFGAQLLVEIARRGRRWGLLRAEWGDHAAKAEEQRG